MVNIFYFQNDLQSHSSPYKSSNVITTITEQQQQQSSGTGSYVPLLKKCAAVESERALFYHRGFVLVSDVNYILHVSYDITWEDCFHLIKIR